MNKRQGLYGKYVPILADGRVRLYLPLEKCNEINRMRADGYELDDESQHLLSIVQLIKDAEGRRRNSEQSKQDFVKENLSDFSREVGSIDVVCPYCLGSINHNWPCEGAVLCGWYDLVTRDCDGNASLCIDRANLVLGIPEVEKYTCPVKKTQLDLTIYEFEYLKDEVEWRVKEIHRSMGNGISSCEAKLSKVFPIRISVRRTNRDFRDFVCSLMEKDAIDWVNTLALGDLAGLLERVRKLHRGLSGDI
jgi:hypothetical protein